MPIGAAKSTVKGTAVCLLNARNPCRRADETERTLDGPEGEGVGNQIASDHQEEEATQGSGCPECSPEERICLICASLVEIKCRQG
jgi:hypothetical protein